MYTLIMEQYDSRIKIHKMDIPQIELNNGVKIPCIGNGPGIVGYSPRQDRISNSLFKRAFRKFIIRPKQEYDYVDAVANSFKIGFSLLDYSSSYGDGHLIGKAIKKSGVSRNDLFITTRISNQAQREQKVRACLMSQLQGMGVDYVDMLMFHWPVTDLYIDTWKEMVQLYKEGYCKCLGVANCHKHHIEELMKAADVVPSINQFEVHPLFTQKDLIGYCWSKGIQVEAYTAIARFDDRLMRLPLLKNIAQKYHKTVVQIILRWHVQTGVIPLVRSLNKSRQLENVSIFDFELTSNEMKAIDAININSRLRYDPDNCDFSIL